MLIWIENQYNIITVRGAIIFALCDKNIIQLFKDQTCLVVRSWFFFFRVTSLQMMYIRDVYLHLILWGTRWPNSRYEHSILEWLQKKGFRPNTVSICTRILKYRVWKIEFDELDFLSISNSNFAGYTGSKNLVQTRQKFQFIKLDFSNSIFQNPSADRYRVRMSNSILDESKKQTCCSNWSHYGEV